MIRKAAYAFSAVFILVGILGFVPGITTTNSDGMKLLLGIFMVGGVHNAIHLLSGVFAFLGARSSESYASLYFKVFGVVYGLVTIIGFAQGNTVLGIIDVNLADNILHLVIAVAALYLGFAVSAGRGGKKVVAAKA